MGTGVVTATLAQTEEQELLRDSVQRYLTDSYDFAERQRVAATVSACDDGHWTAFAELGWLALTVAEDNGGLGGSGRDMLALFEALGEGLVVEPLTTQISVVAPLLQAAVDAPGSQDALASLVSGTWRAALAVSEPGSRYALSQPRTTAKIAESGYVLSGLKSQVVDAPSAQTLFVSAAVADSNELALFQVDPQAAGVRRKDYATIDGRRASDVDLENVRVDSEARMALEDAGVALQDAVDRGAAAACAEAVGIMKVLLTRTAEYLNVRQQFGQPLGKFQALQHRMADMFMSAQRSEALLSMLGLALDHGSREDIQIAVSACKSMCGESGRFIGQQAVQLHGGIGVSNELAIGHYFKRLTALDVWFGDAAYHRDRYSRLRHGH